MSATRVPPVPRRRARSCARPRRILRAVSALQQWAFTPICRSRYLAVIPRLHCQLPEMVFHHNGIGNLLQNFAALERILRHAVLCSQIQPIPARAACRYSAAVVACAGVHEALAGRLSRMKSSGSMPSRIIHHTRRQAHRAASKNIQRPAAPPSGRQHRRRS